MRRFVRQGNPDRWHWPSGQLRILAFVGIALFLLLIGGATAVVLRASYLQDLEQKERQADGLVRLLAQFTRHSIGATDQILQIIIDSGPDALNDHEERFENRLRGLLQRLPFVRALFTAGPDGRITQDTDRPRTPRTSLADRAYFAVHKGNADAGLHISLPLLSRSTDRWFIAASRRLPGPTGDFRGVAVAAIEPVFYERLYGELPLGTDDGIALWHADGTLIARAPEAFGQVGRRISEASLFTEYLPRRKTGIFTLSNPTYLSGPQLIAYRTVPGLPLVVTASLSRAPVIRRLQRLTLIAVGSYVLVCGLAVGLALVVFSHVREQEAMRQRQALLQRTEALGRMTGGIAHDFNNVLAVIDAALRFVLKNPDAPGSVAMYGKTAAEAVQRGARLAEQLLDFAKRQELDPRQADVNELLDKLCPMLRQAAGPAISLGMQLDPELSPCLLDRTQFDAAILNLIINARDAMPDGGEVTITTAVCTQGRAKRAALKPGTYAVVRISDTGPGMPPDVARRAFEPFFTTKGDRGTGLGLSQTYGFMQQLGGDARIDNTPGKGTAIALYFPCDGTA